MALSFDYPAAGDFSKKTRIGFADFNAEYGRPWSDELNFETKSGLQVSCKSDDENMHVTHISIVDTQNNVLFGRMTLVQDPQSQLRERADFFVDDVFLIDADTRSVITAGVENKLDIFKAKLKQALSAEKLPRQNHNSMPAPAAAL